MTLKAGVETTIKGLLHNRNCEILIILAQNFRKKAIIYCGCLFLISGLLRATGVAIIPHAVKCYNKTKFLTQSMDVLIK
jgi:hypothetical protein